MHKAGVYFALAFANTAMQDDDWEMTDALEYAYYAVSTIIN